MEFISNTQIFSYGPILNLNSKKISIAPISPFNQELADKSKVVLNQKKDL